MNINVTATKVTIDKGNVVNKGEYNIRDCIFTLSEEYNDLVCKALFTVEKTNRTYEQSIVNNKCTIPYEVTVEKGAITLGVIGYEIEDDELIKRYSPLPYHFTIEDGSYIEDIENQSTPTPSELEQLEQRVSQVEIDAEQVEINKQDISDIKQEQITQNNGILLRSLITETGSQIELSLNNTNFKMTATLKDKNGTVVNTSNEIDLPLESVVINANYDSSTKEIVLTLQNGNTVRFSVADLVSGLQTEITSTNKLNADLVDDSTSTNKFVTETEKAQIQTNAQDIADIQEEQTTQNENILALQTENTRLKATLPTTTGSGENITLSKTAELEFIQPPLPRGNSEQVQYSGKQLFNASAITNTSIEVSDDGKTIKLPISNTQGYTYTGPKLSELCPTLAVGDTVYLYFTRNLGTSHNNYVYLDGATQLWNNGTAKTITQQMLNGGLSLYGNDYSSGETTQCILTDFRIVKTQNDTWEKFVGGTASPNPSYPQAITNVTGDVEVLLQNKNLATEIVQGNIDTTTGQNIINPNAKYGITPNYIEINQTNIAVQYQLINSTSYQIVLYKYDKDKNFLGFNAKSSNSNVFTVDSNVKYIRVRLETPEANVSSVYDVMIEQNTTATTYTPHKEQTFTFPLGTQRMFAGDYLADDGIHHVRKQITFDGSEDEEWRKAFGSIYNNKCLYTFNLSNNKKTTCLSNKFKFVAGFSEWYDEGINVTRSETRAGLILMADRLNNEYTVEAIKSWLQNNPFMLEYELAEEEITPYTTEQQTAYDEIKQAISYEEQTNISGSSDESNPLFSVEAYQSIKLVLAS